MKAKKYLAIALAAIALGLGSCTTQRTNVTPAVSYSNFETVLMSEEGDGTLTLRVWGKGATEGDAIETAKKNAVRDVIFKGIRSKSGVTSRPLVGEVNARERYAEYFDPFFADGGEYAKFAHEENTLKGSRIVSKGSGQINIGVVVTVDRPALKRQLIDDGVLSFSAY